MVVWKPWERCCVTVDDGEVAQRFLQRADRGRLPYGRCARGRRAHHRRGAHRAADRVRREQPRVSQVRHDVTCSGGVMTSVPH